MNINTRLTVSIQRVTRSKEAARANYNRLSRWYDLLAGSAEQKYRHTGLAKLAAQPGERVLEIGVGTGQSLLVLAHAVGNSGKVVGFDISEGMLQLAQKRLETAGVAERVELHRTDAACPPDEIGTFDAAFMSFTLELFDTPEIPRVLQHCWKALRPGGRICTVTMAKQAQDNHAVRLYEWFHERMPALVDCRPILAGQALQEAGFQIREATELTMWGLPVEVILATRPLS